MIQGEIDKIVALAAAVVVWLVGSVLLDLLALGLASLLPSVIAAKRLARVDLYVGADTARVVADAPM